MVRYFNRHFESRVRLGIMSVLSVNEWVDFTSLKEILEVTDGNLASHIRALEQQQYLEVQKQFVSRKPKTTYRITPMGQDAFKAHLAALESLLS